MDNEDDADESNKLACEK